MLSASWFNCKSIDIKKRKQSINKDIKKEDYEEIEELNFLSFNYSINTNDSIIKQNDLYEVIYQVNFKFKNKNDNFKISYILYDENNNVIIKKDNLKPKKDVIEKNTYFIKG